MLLQHKIKILLIVLFVFSVFFVASLSFDGNSITKKKSEKLEGETVTTSKKVKCENYTVQEAEDKKKSGFDFFGRYGTEGEFSKNGDFTISISPSTSKSNNPVGSDFELYVEKISIVSLLEQNDDLVDSMEKYTVYNSKDYGPDDYRLSKKKSITISRSEVESLASSVTSADADTVLITLKAVKANSDPMCEGTVFYNVEVGLDSFSSAVSEPIEGVETVGDYYIAPVSIDCNNPKDDFEQSYCVGEKGYFNPGTKKTVTVKDKSSDLKRNGGTFKNIRYALKCDAHSIVPSNSSIAKDSASESKYYVNDEILKASHTTSESFGNYTYHYAPGLPTETVPIKVDTTCTETLHVQYGPPVSVKAGICFEYNVKVTSTVVCKASKVPAPKAATYCNPIPKCYHKTGNWTGANAGPNDSFDMCIQQCDGGKYSDYCSQKCYSSIYTVGEKRTSCILDDYSVQQIKSYRKDKNGRQRITTSSNVDKANALIDSINKCLSLEEKSTLKNSHYTMTNYPNVGTSGGINFYGCYYWDESAKEIKWASGIEGNILENSHGKVGNARYAPGRWYGVHRKTSNYAGYSSNDGFMRKAFSSGLCTASCRWDGCSQTEYWNPAQAKADYDENMKVFNDAKTAAEKASTCSEKTTEFTMKVTEYGTYMKSADTLTSKPSGQNIDEKEKLLGKRYVRDYSKCYQTSDINKNEMYQTVWGFPGVWQDAKSMKISFVQVPDSVFISNKFCLPLDAKTVNEKWWTYYYTAQYEHSTTSLTSQTYQDKCMKTTTCTNWVHENDIDWDKDITYNITGSTDNFGHFGWNLDVSCFYAYSTNPTTGKDCKPSIECDSSSGYTVRSVDLSDMFPSPDGETHSADTTGRDTGFNWTKYATNVKKDPNYVSDPIAYLKETQKNEILLRKRGKSTYTNEAELDYRIYLSREDLRNIKKYVTSDSFSYTDYGSRGKFIPNGSVLSYQSNVLRSTTSNGLSVFNSDNILVDESLLKCNNVDNGKCAQFVSEVKE